MRWSEWDGLQFTNAWKESYLLTTTCYWKYCDHCKIPLVSKEARCSCCRGLNEAASKADETGAASAVQVNIATHDVKRHIYKKFYPAGWKVNLSAGFTITEK